jgi:hypothetical protein
MAFTDPFSGSGVLAAPWLARLGVWSQTGGYAYISTSGGTGSYDLTGFPTVSADGGVGVTVITAPSSEGGIYFRRSGPADFWMWVLNAFGQAILRQTVAGVETALYTSPGGGGGMLSVVLSGTSVDARLGGSSLHVDTSGFNATANDHGIIAVIGDSVHLDDYFCPDAAPVVSPGGGNFFLVL